MKVLQLAYNSVIAGHFGLESTLEEVRRRMNWPGIVQIFKNFVSHVLCVRELSWLWLPESHYILYK